MVCNYSHLILYFTVQECWVVQMSMRGQDDVYDLAWAPDATALLSASTDCSARVWDLLKNGRPVQELKDHRHYVQGTTQGDFAAATPLAYDYVLSFLACLLS